MTNVSTDTTRLVWSGDRESPTYVHLQPSPVPSSDTPRQESDNSPHVATVSTICPTPLGVRRPVTRTRDRSPQNPDNNPGDHHTYVMVPLSTYSTRGPGTHRTSPIRLDMSPAHHHTNPCPTPPVPSTRTWGPGVRRTNPPSLLTRTRVPYTCVDPRYDD